MDNLTVIIPFFNGHQTIQRLLDSLPADLPVIVVDDMSDEPFNPPIRDGLTVIGRNLKGYFTGAANRGIEACNTDVLILNQDTWLEGDAWLNLIADKRGYFGLFGENIKGNHPAYSHGYVQGTFMFIRRDVIENVGPMNEALYPLWGSTCEYQLRVARKGYRPLPLDEIPGFHHRDKPQQFGDSINTILKREPSRRREFIRTPPEVSVVIPCYNYGRYLNDAVWSVLLSTFQSTEVIIVDDKSTDDSLKIAQAIAKNPYLGVRVVALPQNRGTAAAQNAGIEAAYGKYIALLSADDMMSPNRLENFYRLQQENPHSFIYDDLILFGSEVSRLPGRVKRGDDVIFPLPEYDFEALIKKNGVHGGIFFPKQAWEEAGGYPEMMAYGREDWAFNVALGLKGWCGVKCDTPGYLYRRDGQNRTIRNTDPRSRQGFLGQMLALYPEVYRGYRPMGCCGSKSSGAVQRLAPLNGGGVAMAASLPGKDGFEILEYIGGSASDMTWYGPETRTRYVFGGNRRVGYVDKKDVAKMIALQDQGRQVFRVYQKPEVKAPVLEIPDAREAARTDDFGGGSISQPVSLPFDPSASTLAQIRSQVEGLSDEELEALLEAEKNGLNRKGALAVLEGALANA